MQLIKSVVIITIALGLMIDASNSIGTPASTPLSIKVATDIGSPINFVLDRKTSCKIVSDYSKEVSCIFSEDCSKFPGQTCVQANIRRGRHLIKADYGDGSISKWLVVEEKPTGNDSSHIDGECSFSESMGIVKFFLNCDLHRK